MGRPRKPTALKVLDGDRPDRIHGDEPTAPAGLGDPPDWLDRFGREAWTRLEGEPRASRVLTRLDAEAATLYCCSYSSYRHALAKITRDSARSAKIAEDDDQGGGDEPEKPHPQYRIVNATHRQMMAILSKFGMTPSDRAGLHLDGPPEADELLSFLATPPAPAPTPHHVQRGGKKAREPVDPQS